MIFTQNTKKYFHSALVYSENVKKFNFGILCPIMIDIHKNDPNLEYIFFRFYCDGEFQYEFDYTLRGYPQNVSYYRSSSSNTHKIHIWGYFFKPEISKSTQAAILMNTL